MNSLLLAYCLALLGFAALALGMERHRVQLIEGALSTARTRAAQLVGAALLVGALSVCVTRWLPSVGSAAWLGVLSLAAMTLGVAFSYGSRRALSVLLGLAACSGVVLWLLSRT